MDLSKIAQNLIKCVSTGEVRALTVSESILETNFFTIVNFVRSYRSLWIAFRKITCTFPTLWTQPNVRVSTFASFIFSLRCAIISFCNIQFSLSYFCYVTLTVLIFKESMSEFQLISLALRNMAHNQHIYCPSLWIDLNDLIQAIFSNYLQYNDWFWVLS